VSGNDVLVSTHTGSGKTLSFLVPLAERILFETSNNSGGVKVIVIAPGRELASQIVAVARDLLKETGLTSMLAIGGTPFTRNYDQIRKKKPDILIGTPGRIAELVVGQPGDKSGKLKISNVQAIVLDECDALLEYEPHKDPTSAIMNMLKRRHGESLQSILCSATAGDLMGKSLLDGILRQGYAHAQTDDNDNLVTSGSGQTTRVSRTAMHGVVHVPHKRFVLDTLKKILYTEPVPQQVLIFVDNARRVGIVVDKLAEMSIIAAPLHGGSGSEKSDRTEVNKLFREGYIGLVVATEMAARGIDAPFLTHVINLDLPTDASHYAHRAGRCARGGRPGVVINIAVGSREKNVPLKFAKALDIQMHTTELQNGKLVVVEDQGKESNPQDS
jgi:superfamily II DNA/RNA helicase